MLIFSNFSSAANSGKRRRHVDSSQLPGRGNELTGYPFLFPPHRVRYKNCILRLCFFCSFKALLLKNQTHKIQKTSKKKKMLFCMALRQQTPSSVHGCATALCFSVSQCSSVSAKCPHTDGKTASAVIFGAGGSTLWT